MQKKEDVDDLSDLKINDEEIIDFDQFEQDKEDIIQIQENIDDKINQFQFIDDEERKEDKKRQNSIIQFQDDDQDNVANFGSIHKEEDFLSWKDDNKQIDQNEQQEQQQHEIFAMTERQRDENILIKELSSTIDLQSFLNKSIEQHHQIQLILRKDNSGTNKFHPKFLLYFNNNLQFLCSAKRIAFSQQTHYVISLLKDKFERKHKSCLGKIKGQAGIFKLYDTGDNPNNAKFLDKVRKELCLIYFQSSKVVGQYRQSIIIPRIVNGQPIEFKPLNDTDGLLKAYYSLQYKDKIQHFINKTALYNKQKQKYELQFTDRVTQASIKNCIFEDINNQNKNNFVLQFGKCGKQTFSIDICHPLSILQGLSICISQFEKKK